MGYKAYNGYVLVETKKEFGEYLKDGGWEDEDDFKKETGLVFEELKDSWFQVSHGRIYDMPKKEQKEVNLKFKIVRLERELKVYADKKELTLEDWSQAGFIAGRLKNLHKIQERLTNKD
ncbi:MAG: hypothetical protein GY797_17690 [Deltaproteobacteria bacterium]|nr:hypothetical protein [Deltaproteobacteria bacterium]